MMRDCFRCNKLALLPELRHHGRQCIVLGVHPLQHLPDPEAGVPTHISHQLSAGLSYPHLSPHLHPVVPCEDVLPPHTVVRQYCSCSCQQIPQLLGMMELLEEIAREEDIKTSLSGDQEQSPRQPPVNFNSPDLKNLRERLLKEVVSSSNARVIIEKPKVKTLFDTRPNLTANFLLPGADTPMMAKDSMSCLKGVPAMSQETFTFSLDRDIDQSLQALIMRLLPLATNYSNVVSWCEEIDRTDGLVNKAQLQAAGLPAGAEPGQGQADPPPTPPPVAVQQALHGDPQ
jgi:hypothetical protein